MVKSRWPKARWFECAGRFATLCLLGVVPGPSRAAARIRWMVPVPTQCKSGEFVSDSAMASGRFSGQE